MDYWKDCAHIHQEFNWKSQNPLTHRLWEGSFIVLRYVWLWVTLNILILNFSLLSLALLGFNTLQERLPCFCIKHFPHCLVAVRYNTFLSLDQACAAQKRTPNINKHLLWASVSGCRETSIQEDTEMHISCCSGTPSWVFEHIPVHIQLCTCFYIK